MPEHIKRQNDILDLMREGEGLDIFSELVAQKDGAYEHELDLDVILYGRGYTGGRVGPYVRLLSYGEGEKIISEGDWSVRRATPSRRGAGAPHAGGGETETGEGEWDGNSFYILVKGKLNVEFGGEKPFECSEPGTMIGTMMLVEGERAEATVSVPEGASALVLEVKRPAIRLLRKYQKFSRAFDKEYRKHGRRRTLRDIRKAGSRTDVKTGDEFWAERWARITEQAQFEVHDTNHELFRAGLPITHIFLVRRGWVEVGVPAGGGGAASGGEGEARRGLRQLGPGNCFGLEALSDEGARWGYGAKLLSRAELLTLPVEFMRREPELAAAVRRMFSDFSKADQEALLAPESERVAAARRQEITTGLVDATNLLVMDMDLCVRCGNCSLACHKVHGQSRLVRRGIQIERPPRPDAVRQQHALTPMVCLHCQDPECLTGCPTGAIGRHPEGEIDINPQTCIGCGDCATQCPYNAISLVIRTDERREAAAAKKLAEKKIAWAQNAEKKRAALGSGAERRRSWRRLKARGVLLSRRVSIRPAAVNVQPPPPTSEPLVAIKCNLCQGTPLNPRWARRRAYSCEENCPTGALARVNPREYYSEIKNVIGTIYADQTHAIGRNIHRRDWPALLWHAGGILATSAAVAAAGWAAYRYGLKTPLPGTGWTLRWITGFAGLLGICVALAYFLRKQVYRWRAGPLRYWLLAHIYFSVFGASVLMVHAGRHTGSLLASALTISFDLVILSGLFGLACYKLAPRVMSRIEGEPLLVEDLLARRAELHEQLGRLGAGDKRLRALVAQVTARFFTPRYLWRQFARRESLTVLLAEARGEFDREADAQGMDRPTRAALITAIETAATARRVEALIYLHRLLKLWVPPHVASTVLMLVLLAAHIAQAFYFAVR
jgi:Fe-S-cluster-containing dehydrogenase component